MDCLFCGQRLTLFQEMCGLRFCCVEHEQEQSCLNELAIARLQGRSTVTSSPVLNVPVATPQPEPAEVLPGMAGTAPVQQPDPYRVVLDHTAVAGLVAACDEPPAQVLTQCPVESPQACLPTGDYRYPCLSIEPPPEARSGSIRDLTVIAPVLNPIGRFGRVSSPTANSRRLAEIRSPRLGLAAPPSMRLCGVVDVALFASRAADANSHGEMAWQDVPVTAALVRFESAPFCRVLAPLVPVATAPAGAPVRGNEFVLSPVEFLPRRPAEARVVETAGQLELPAARRVSVALSPLAETRAYEMELEAAAGTCEAPPLALGSLSVSATETLAWAPLKRLEIAAPAQGSRATFSVPIEHLETVVGAEKPRLSLRPMRNRFRLSGKPLPAPLRAQDFPCLPTLRPVFGSFPDKSRAVRRIPQSIPRPGDGTHALVVPARPPFAGFVGTRAGVSELTTRLAAGDRVMRRNRIREA